MPATGDLMGTPASISASVEPQTEAIEVEPLELRISETNRIVLRPFLDGGITASQRALGQRSVSDLAPAWTTQRPSLAH